MPSDIHMLPGDKKYIENGDEILRLVREKWPGAMREGACGTMSFTCQGQLVGEAWISPRGWWYRIAERRSPPHGKDCCCTGCVQDRSYEK